MIKGKYFEETFTIDQGEVTGSAYIKEMHEILSEPAPEVSEGDPDMVMFDRLFEALIVVDLIEYVPQKIDPDVVY